MKTLLIIILFTFSQISLANSTKKQTAQQLDFEGMNINSTKGSPGGALVTSKKDANFDYFFNTKIDFKRKILESFESVR